MPTATIAAIAMALVVTVCLIPAAADDSDADGTDTHRMGAYLFGGELTVPEDIGYYLEPETLFNDDFIYLIEGSENYERMMEYIDDVTDDDPANDAAPTPSSGTDRSTSRTRAPRPSCWPSRTGS